MDSQRIRKPITQLGPCSRCGLGLFREKLPIVSFVRVYDGAAKEVESAAGQMMAGYYQGTSLGIAEIMYPLDITFEVTSNADLTGDRVLCFRCVVALAQFMAAPSDEEIQFNNELQRTASMLRQQGAR